MIIGTLLAELLARFWRPIAALFAGLASYFKGKSDARRDAKSAADEHAVEVLKDAARLDDDLRRKSPDELRDEVARWER